MAKVIKASGLKEDKNAKHAKLQKTIDAQNPKFLFSIARNPVNWYISRWSAPHHRMRLRNKGFASFDSMRGAGTDFANEEQTKDLSAWVNYVLNKKNNSFLTNFFKLFLGDDLNSVDFVCKTENLREDTVQALKKAGEKFNKNFILNYEVVNPSSDEYKSAAFYNKKTLRRVIDAEYEIFKRFDYSTKVSDYEHLIR